MGSMVLRLLLRGPPWEGVNGSEFRVRICERGLRVANPQRPEATEAFLEDALNGDFPQEVLVGSSWWALEATGDCPISREQVLVVHLAKAKDGSWKAPFLPGDPSEAAELAADWTTLRPGARPSGDGDGGGEEVDLGVTREDLFEELVVQQTEELVTLRLLLRQVGLDQARKLAPMSRLWGLDITEDSLQVFLRSRGRPTLLDARLGGRVAAAQTDWSMMKVTREASAPGSGAGSRQTVPALSVQLRKASEYRQLWDPVLVHDALSSAGGGGAAREDLPLGELDDDGNAPAALALEAPGQTPEDRAKGLKSKGDECFRKRDWDAAVDFYTQALGHTPDAETLLSNRSAALAEAGRFQPALDDALRAAEVAPQWPKPYFRQGVALRALRRYDMAVSVFSEGRSRDPKNPNWQREIEATEALKAERQAARAARRQQ